HSDHRDISDVPEIQVANVVEISRVARPISLTRGEREPGNRGSFLRAQPDTWCAEERHHCRHIKWTRNIGSGNPGPVVVDQPPTAVMRRGESPGSIVDPGPAPQGDPAPTTEAIGRPFGRLGRERHEAV